jgi:predicted transcriptional regulator
MSKDEIKQKIYQLIDEMEDETALQMLYEDAVEYKTASHVDDEDLTEVQWAAIETAREQIKKGEYHTYEEVKEHFSKWLTK